MAITTAELVKSLTGATSDGAAQASSAESLGGFRGNTTITDSTDENLFDNITGLEAAEADYTDYRCLVFQNTDAALTLSTAKIFISADDSNSDTTYSFCLERPQTSLTTGTAQLLTDEGQTDAPDLTNATYHTSGAWTVSTSMASYATGLVVGPLNSMGTTGLAPNELIYVWVKRVVGVNAAAASDVAFTITLQGDTAV